MNIQEAVRCYDIDLQSVSIRIDDVDVQAAVRIADMDETRTITIACEQAHVRLHTREVDIADADLGIYTREADIPESHIDISGYCTNIAGASGC